MVFHNEHMHGRVFHGLEARNYLEQHKRDSHDDHPKVNVPKDDNKLRFIHNAGKEVDVETVYSQVYVTESPTFSGPVATYVTETPTTPVTAVGTPVEAAQTLNSAQASYANAKSLANNPSAGTSALPATTTTSATRAVGSPQQFTRSSSATHAVGSPIQGSSAANADPVKGTPVSATRNPEMIAQKSDGMTGGQKAGVAFGVIIGIALIAGLLFFCWRRRKAQEQKKGEQLDEKHVSQNSLFGGTAAAFGAPAGERLSIQSEKSLQSGRTATTAPRLSLRPVTQFLPNMMENRKSTGNNSNAPSMSEKPNSAWERRPQKSENPFSDAAVASDNRPQTPSSNPFQDGQAKNAPGHSAMNSWDGTEPGTPTVATASAVPVAGAAASGSPNRGPNNVHRVQLDFKPSMDDELELKSGQLVRMLHAYDDGWALCIRMDRSQQGVCPRTCLSKLPVKPRPQGPPPNGPNGRGPSSPGSRGPSPPQKGNAMYPRPLTPTGRERSATGPRPMPSPVPQEAIRNRSQSVTVTDRPVSPIESGVPARKPVPGQAL